MASRLPLAASLLLRRLLQHRPLLLLLELLQPVVPLLLLLRLHALLRLHLLLQARLLLLRGALHALLREGLVPDEAAVHALHGHLPRPRRLLDAVPVGLADLVAV